jgi:hypothetical protein
MKEWGATPHSGRASAAGVGTEAAGERGGRAPVADLLEEPNALVVVLVCTREASRRRVERAQLLVHLPEPQQQLRTALRARRRCVGAAHPPPPAPMRARGGNGDSLVWPVKRRFDRSNGRVRGGTWAE